MPFSQHVPCSLMISSISHIYVDILDFLAVHQRAIMFCITVETADTLTWITILHVTQVNKTEMRTKSY